MRVLHVISDTNIGGAGVLLCSLLNNFDRSRVQSIVALPEGSELSPRIRALETPIHPLNVSPDRISYTSISELSRLIRSAQVDLVHTNAALSARVAARFCHVPVLHTRHCCFPPSGILRVPPIRFLSGLCNRALSDHVIATASAAVRDLTALGIPTHRISCIINGSEEARVVSTAEKHAFLSRWGLRESDFMIGIVARLVPCKGHDIFLHAAREAMDRMPEKQFRFLIVGDGEQRAALERLTRELMLTEQVRFLGFQADVAPVWSVLRLNVNCSRGTETSCLALSEGMSAGVPMVVSDYGGNPAMLGENGVAGFLCPAESSTAFADAFCRIAASPLLEAGMRTAAKDRFLSHYTARGMTERVMELYDEILATYKK